MIYSLLAAAGQEVDSVTGNVVPHVSIPEALLYALVGFLVTFMGIIILIFFVWLCGRVMKAVTLRKKEKKEEPAAQAAPSEGKDAEEVDARVRAAIVAAVAAYLAGENSSCEFKVKRIKRL